MLPHYYCTITNGNEFQADGAETAKALSVNRGVMKVGTHLDRYRISEVHGI